MKKNRLAVAACLGLAITLGLGLTACGNNTDSESKGTTTTAAGASNGDPSNSTIPEAAKKYEEEAQKRGEPQISKAEMPTDLVITDDVVGTGTEVKAGSTVTVQYKGAAASTGQEFDSSWSRGGPITFPLDGVIEGWSKGLVGMKEGGRRTLVIPPAMAYGNGGPAPGDALVFVVDLIHVKNP